MRWWKQRTAPAPLELLEQSGGVDLLFTDMVMPGGISGARLIELVRETRPELKVLLTTGYAEETTAEGAPLLRKPYRIAELARALREALGD